LEEEIHQSGFGLTFSRLFVWVMVKNLPIKWLDGFNLCFAGPREQTEKCSSKKKGSRKRYFDMPKCHHSRFVVEGMLDRFWMISVNV